MKNLIIVPKQVFAFKKKNEKVTMARATDDPTITVTTTFTVTSF